MTFAIRHINQKAKPGHEMQYWLAWKHRLQAGKLMQQYSGPLKCKAYDRAFRLWADALDRIAEHGQDVVVYAPETTTAQEKGE